MKYLEIVIKRQNISLILHLQILFRRLDGLVTTKKSQGIKSGEFSGYYVHYYRVQIMKYWKIFSVLMKHHPWLSKTSVHVLFLEKIKVNWDEEVYFAYNIPESRPKGLVRDTQLFC